MNKRHIESMIPVAMDLLAGGKAGILKDGRIPSTYSGYVDSYGPTIRLSGLMQAMSFYEKDRSGDDSGADRKTGRYRINDLLYLLLARAKLIDSEPEKRLIDIVKDKSSDSSGKRKLQALTLEAIIACKLAMRTFPKADVDGGN